MKTLQEAIDILANWFDSFTTWVAEILLDIMNNLIEAFSSLGLLTRAINTRSTMMRKKIQKYYLRCTSYSASTTSPASRREAIEAKR